MMTIREAVGLVLLAGLGGYGDLCILDMGEPIRIVDLARMMITMAGWCRAGHRDRVHRPAARREAGRGADDGRGGALEPGLAGDTIRVVETPPPGPDFGARLERMAERARVGDRARRACLPARDRARVHARGESTPEPETAAPAAASAPATEPRGLASDSLARPRARAATTDRPRLRLHGARALRDPAASSRTGAARPSSLRGWPSTCSWACRRCSHRPAGRSSPGLSRCCSASSGLTAAASTSISGWPWCRSRRGSTSSTGRGALGRCASTPRVCSCSRSRRGLLSPSCSRWRACARSPGTGVRVSRLSVQCFRLLVR